LSLKDVIYLEAGRKLKAEEDAKLEQSKFEFQLELEKHNRLLLLDIRQICFSNLYFETDSSRERYFNSLPSNVESCGNQSMKHVARGHGVRKVKKKEEKAPE
jgi:hypothetical protein